LQPVAQIARGHISAFASCERRGVDRELHGDGGLVDHDVGQRRRVLHLRDGLADVDALHAGDSDDVAQLSLLDVHALQAVEGKQLGDLDFLERSIELGDGRLFAVAQAAIEDAGNRHPAQVIAVVQVGHQNLQWIGSFAGRRGNGGEDGVEERPQILAGSVDRGRSGAGLGVGVEHWKVELVFMGVQIDEKIV